MSSISAPAGSKVGISPEALSRSRVAVLLSFTLLVAFSLYYMVGMDEGMTSIFGKSMVVHEWVHDARHFLGFPCH